MQLVMMIQFHTQEQLLVAKEPNRQKDNTPNSACEKRLLPKLATEDAFCGFT